MTAARRWPHRPGPGLLLRRAILWSNMLWLAMVSASPAEATALAAATPAAEIIEIADGIYVRPGRTAVLFEADNVANLGLVIGTRCVAVIDSGGSPAEGRAFDAAIGAVTDLPVCYVINTHVHPDHVLGNAAFEREDVEFIGHDNLPRAMALRGDIYLQRASEYFASKPGSAEDTAHAGHIVLPERTIAGQVQLDLGQRILTLRTHATAHTDNDLSVLDVQTGTLFIGDLAFLDHLPVLDGSINGWLDELEKLMGETYWQVVPGHGPARADWPQGGAATADYLHDLRQSARTWIARGGDLAAAQERIEPARPERWQLIGQYHKRNVAAAFAELEWED